MMIDGERAAVHSRVKIRYVPRNMTVTTDLLDTFHFRDGKIVEFVEFADTALVKDLMSPA
jgi:ketosteroid isomerase-like protein